jgi:hypothetical protein
MRAKRLSSLFVGSIVSLSGLTATITSFSAPAFAGAAAIPVSVTPGSTAYTPVTPSRLADTRNGSTVGFSRLSAPNDNIIRVPVAGFGGVPADATAVSLLVTETGNSAPGFLTVFPAGTATPNASNLNMTAAGQTRANSAVVALNGGAVDILVSGATSDVIVDVTGSFSPRQSSTSGRFVAFTSAERLLDTRSAGPSGKPPAGSILTIPLSASVPSDAVALAVNLTVTETTGPGFFSLWAAGQPQPGSSNGNSDAVGQTRAVFGIVPVSASGLSLFTQSGSHVIVDVAGYFTGPSAVSSPDGLFLPSSPSRLIDTRSGSPIWPNGAVEFSAPQSAKSVWLNLTLTQTQSPGFLTAFAAGSDLPATSNVNASEFAETVANAAIVAVSTRGVSAYAHDGTHFIADLAGSFLGTPQTALKAALPNDKPATVVPALQTVLDAWAAKQTVPVGVVIRELTGAKRSASLNASSLYATASTYKAWVGWQIMVAVDAGRLSVGQVDGDMRAMILDSNNDSARYLASLLGWSNIENAAHAAGMPSVCFISLSCPGAGQQGIYGGANWTTPDDAGKLMAGLANGVWLTPGSNSYLLSLLNAQRAISNKPGNLSVGAGLQGLNGVNGALVFDKPGWLATGEYQTIADNGFVTLNNGTKYTIAVYFMSRNGGSHYELFDQIDSLNRAVSAALT